MLLSGCEQPAAPPEPVRPVKVWTVAPGAAAQEQVLAGAVVARYDAPLAFQVGGKVIERRVNLGDSVRAGQILGRLDVTDYRLAAEAQASSSAALQTELKLAEADLARYRSLRQQGFISEIDLDRRQTAVDAARDRVRAAQANAAQARRQLDYAALVAAHDGLVSGLNFEVGQVVAAGQPVAKLAQRGPREILVYVPEALVSAMQGTPILRVAISTHPEKSYPGTLRELAAAADPATRTYAARIAVEAGEADLPLGASATLRVQSPHASLIRLPLAAVMSRDGAARVWKYDAASGTVRAAAITTGGMDGDSWVVNTGLAPGEVVVVAGANMLREGQKVKPLP